MNLLSPFKLYSLFFKLRGEGGRMESQKFIFIESLLMDIKSLQKKYIKFRDKRNWKQFHNPKDLAISLSLEASEVLEHFQWKNPKEIKDYIKSDKIEHLEEELADVAIYLFLLAYELGIDLEKAYLDKIRKNRRKYPVNKAKGSHKKYTEYE